MGIVLNCFLVRGSWSLLPFFYFRFLWFTYAKFGYILSIPALPELFVREMQHLELIRLFSMRNSEIRVTPKHSRDYRNPAFLPFLCRRR